MQILKTLAGYKLQIIGTLAAAGVLIAAGIAVDRIAYNRGLNKSEVVISQFQTKVAKLNADLIIARNTVTERVVTEYLTNTIERERIVYRNRDVIITQVPEQFILSQGWVYAHDQSAKSEEIDPDIARNAFPSGTADVEALAVVSANYAICAANLAQLTALQQWTREIQEASYEVVDNQ
jgi:hypothetical protein